MTMKNRWRVIQLALERLQGKVNSKAETNKKERFTRLLRKRSLMEIPSFKEDHISQIPALQMLVNLGYTYCGQSVNSRMFFWF